MGVARFSTHIASFAFQSVVVCSLLGLFKDKRRKNISCEQNLFVWIEMD